jgi:hypothetical protein
MGKVFSFGNGTVDEAKEELHVWKKESPLLTELTSICLPDPS